MYMKTKKIQKTNYISFVDKPYNIVLIAEGFTTAMEKAFWNTCVHFWEKLKLVTPFNLLGRSNHFLNIFGCFEAGSSIGPSLNSNQTHNTLLKTTLDINTGNFTVDFEQLKEITTSIKDKIGVEYDSLNRNVLYVVLIPPIEEYPSGIEYEFTPTDEEEDTPYFIATTTNQFWEQIIIRAFAKLIDLGDEYALEEEEYYVAPAPEGNWLTYQYPNLLYNPNQDIEIHRNEIKWKDLIDKTTTNLSVHSFDAQTPYEHLYQEDILGLWEGGGMYQKHMYRSGKNCLLGQKIGGENSLLKDKKTPFCPVCEQYIKSRIIKTEKDFEMLFHQINTSSQ